MPFSVFFNTVFGDFDVTPAQIELTLRDGTMLVVPISVQPAGQDGLIQATSSTLIFSDVFMGDGLGNLNAFLDAKFDSPNEPYTAFDFVELSRIRIDVPVPEPTTILLLGLGLAGLGFIRRRLHLPCAYTGRALDRQTGRYGLRMVGLSGGQAGSIPALSRVGFLYTQLRHLSDFRP